MKLKIITFNIWDIPFWFSKKREERVHRIGDYLKSFNPDIICLQEAFDVKHRTRIHNALGRELYNIIEEYDETRRVLLFKRFDLTGGLVIFSKFPIETSVFYPFERPMRMALPERIGRKGFLKTLLKTPEGLLLVVNAHLYQGWRKHNQKMRTRQLQQLLENLNEGDHKLPIIMTGDFNEDGFKERKHFFTLIRNEKFEDSAVILKKQFEETCRTDNQYILNSLWERLHRLTPYRLDFIFSRPAKNQKIG